MSSHEGARVEVTRDPRSGVERYHVYCPSGHETVSGGVNTARGRRVLAGDLSREWCGYGSCEWEGDK